MRKLYIAICLLFTPLFSVEEEIKIYLQTESKATPIYVADFQGANPTYLNQLRSILKYDLDHDGSSRVMAQSSEKEDLLKSENKQTAFSPITWKALGAMHVATVKVSDNQLQLSLFSVGTQTLKHFPSFHLTGNLLQDRRIIHQCADLLHKVLYGKDGVANTKLLYCVQISGSGPAKKWISEVWECDWDGANARQVTKENSYCVTPAYLPSTDGANDRFIYVSYKKGQPKIYLASLKDGNGQRLVSLRGNQLLPAVSFQKDKIAFICDASGRTDLFLQHLHPQSGKASTPVQLFSYPRSTQASPTFSPDGKKIAFVSDKDGGARIYTIPSDGGTKRAAAQLLTKKNQENSCPAWSPDGKKIAYSAKTKGVRQIWIYDLATGEESQLTDGPGHKENPAWAPDSLHLIFNSTGTEQSELYMVNLNQPEVVKITQGPGKKDYPAWGKR